MRYPGEIPKLGHFLCCFCVPQRYGNGGSRDPTSNEARTSVLPGARHGTELFLLEGWRKKRSSLVVNLGEHWQLVSGDRVRHQ